jgi:hypothetical protein
VQKFSKNSVIGLKVARAYAFIVGPLPPPLGVEGSAPALVIVVDGVGVDATNRPLVMEK